MKLYLILICILIPTISAEINSINIEDSILYKNYDNNINFLVLDKVGNLTDPENIYLNFSSNVSRTLYRNSIGNYTILLNINTSDILNLTIKVQEKYNFINSSHTFNVTEKKPKINIKSKILILDDWIKENSSLLLISSLIMLFSLIGISILLKVLKNK